MKTILAALLFIATCCSAQAESAAPAASFSELLTSSTWEWFSGKANTVPEGEVRFLPDGKVETKIHYIVGWKRVSGNRIRVLHMNGRYWVFEYRSSGRQALTVNEKGSLGEDKMLRAKK